MTNSTSKDDDYILKYAAMIKISGRIVNDIILDWCDDNFGKDWNYMGYGKFVFKNESDAILFKLRWG